MMEVYSIVLFVVLTVGAEVTPDCNLPSTLGIDWGNVTGEYYEILNTGVPLDSVTNCFRSRAYESKDNVLQKVTFTDFHKRNKTYGEVTLDYKLQNNGVYRQDTSNGLDFTVGFEEDALSKHDMSIADNYGFKFANGEWSFATDYDNFVIYLMCFEGGERGIWVHGHNPIPSADDVLRVTRKLIEVGNGWQNIPLQRALCPAQKVLDTFVNEFASPEK